MNGRGAPIAPRRRFFLGCEGESEQSYGARLQEIADELNLHIHLDTQVLGGGDPLASVEEAARVVRRRVNTRGAFVARAILLDADKLGQVPERDQKIEPIALRQQFHLIWQRPCHEAFLLRHLLGRQAPMVANQDFLRQHWPAYKKPMSAIRLGRRIGLAEVQTAASLEPQLRDFLSRLGFPLT